MAMVDMKMRAAMVDDVCRASLVPAQFLGKDLDLLEGRQGTQGGAIHGGENENQ